MSSYNTTLSLVNFSGKKITQTVISNLDAHDWDYEKGQRTEPWRPDMNFTGALVDLDARCEREEINAAANEGSNFDLRVTFEDATFVQFHVDQRDALSKLSGVYQTVKSPSRRNRPSPVCSITAGRSRTTTAAKR